MDMADIESNKDEILNDLQKQLDEVISDSDDNSDSNTIPFSELWENKDIEQQFLIPEILPAHAVAILAGEDGIGKTQLALQLCLSIAMGEHSFLTQQLITKHKRAMFCATEDGKEKFTLAAVKQAISLKKDLKPDEVKLDFVEGSNFNELPELFLELELNWTKNGYDLIVIDALSDLFGLIDGEINSSNHARKILNIAQKFCEKHETTMIIIHHVPKTKIYEKHKLGKLFLEKGDVQGASAITQKPRTILGLTHDKKSSNNSSPYYTNYFHALKANLMGKYFVNNALEISFDSSTLLHTYRNTVDIQLYEDEDGMNNPEDKSHAIVKTDNISYETHYRNSRQILKDSPGLVRSDLVREIQSVYSVGRNKVEQKEGIINQLLNLKLIVKEGMKYVLNPDLNDLQDIVKDVPKDDGEDAPF